MTWAKIDDSFPEHPKIVAAGPICELLQIRAICYCARYLTDGFLPERAVPSLTVRLDRISIEEGTVGDGDGVALASFGRDAHEIDWPGEMVRAGLWHRRKGGYVIHDFLHYQRSRAEVFAEKMLKRQGGSKGASVTNLKRWGSASVSAYADPHADAQATEKESAARICSSSTSSTTATTKRQGGSGGGGSLSDDEFIHTLRDNPGYAHMNVDAEMARMDAWLLANPQRKKTRRFIVAWLNRTSAATRVVVTVPKRVQHSAAATARLDALLAGLPKALADYVRAGARVSDDDVAALSADQRERYRQAVAERARLPGRAKDEEKA